MFDRTDSTGTHTRAMNKSQKGITKVKRGKQRHITHTTGTHHTTRHTHGKTRQDMVEAEMEKSRKAVEQKLISLSLTNQATAPIRPGKRGSKGTAVGAAGPVVGTAGGGGGGGGEGGANRRKHSKKQGEPRAKPEFILDEPSHEKPEKIESRIRGGYNVFLESPRRNGLTPRDYAAEAELAAVLAAQRNAGGSNSKMGGRMQEKTGDADADGSDQLAPVGTYGPLGGHPRYKCGECGARFHVRSLLGAHRRTHDDDFKVRFCGRIPRDSNTTLTASNQCKFCDRKFDLVRTLHIHQLTHCKKIPPQLRRKLAYTELAHEKKAPLPSFQRNIHHSHHSHHSHRSHRHHHNKEERARDRELKSLMTTHGMKHPLLQQTEELTKTILQSSAQHERWR